MPQLCFVFAGALNDVNLGWAAQRAIWLLMSWPRAEAELMRLGCAEWALTLLRCWG
jgi:hypothetical protein